jgi:predicted extracellular nuclease
MLLAATLLAAAPIAASAAVVINEVDYDQPGTDTAEFIELYNNGPAAVNLGTYTVELMNGNNGVLYGTVVLPAATLPAGGYFVIGFGSANPWHADFVANNLDNSIQNGSPDAIGLRDGGVLVDAVSYEGDTVAPYTEGTGFTGADDNVTANLGISRYPDGQDTNDNNTDWSLRCITPGGPNAASTGGCASPVPALGSTWGALKSLYR